MNATTETRWIALAGRVYEALLALYPADYRRDYGRLMAQLFRDVSRERYRRAGWPGIMVWWLKTLLDLSLTVIEQRRKVKFSMVKTRLIQMSPVLLVIGGALTAVAAFSQLQPGDHYRYDGVYQLLLLLVAPGFVLTGLGSIGLALRYERALGAAGKWTLAVSGVLALVMALGLGVSSLNAALWNVWLAAGVAYTLALAAFGLLHARRPALPVFRWLPFQIAGGWLLMLSGVTDRLPQTSENLLAFLIFLGMGLAWLGIGLAVQRQGRTPALATT